MGGDHGECNSVVNLLRYINCHPLIPILETESLSPDKKTEPLHDRVIHSVTQTQQCPAAPELREGRKQLATRLWHGQEHREPSENDPSGNPKHPSPKTSHHQKTWAGHCGWQDTTCLQDSRTMSDLWVARPTPDTASG